MRRPPRRAASAAAAGLRPLLLFLPFAALLCVATFSLHYPDRLGPTTVTVTATAAAATDADAARPQRLPSPRSRLEISGVDFRALNATAPLHAAAVRAFRDGGRLLRDALSVPASVSATAAPSPAPPRCPPSVARSGEALRAAGSVLALPCGLALGSHVTVVASPRRVPGGGLVQFAVELRGAGDGDAASTILHFNPRLRGDWSGRPVIELNTRFRGQWGTAQRCEGWRRSDEETGA
jgi:hypothetical protein